MTKAEWWRDDSHPDAKEHRKHLERTAKEAAEQALAMIPTVPPSRPRRKVARISDAELEMIGGFVGRAIQPLQQKIAYLEERASKAMSWRGTWRAGESYAANDIVQDRGTIHVCAAAKSDARPGSGAGWRMLIKTGGAK